MHPDFFKKIEPLVRLAELITPYLENGRMENILVKMETALDMIIGQQDSQGSEPAGIPAEVSDTTDLFTIEGHVPDPAYWLVPKEAWHMLGIKSSAFYVRVARGDFKIYHKKAAKGQSRPHPFFSRQQVVASARTHFPNQGKGRRRDLGTGG